MRRSDMQQACANVEYLVSPDNGTVTMHELISAVRELNGVVRQILRELPL